MSYLGDDPPDEDLAREEIWAELATVHTAVPGRVLKYDPDEQRAEVAFVIRQSRRDPETLERTPYMPRPVANVPVIFPGSGDVSITWTLKKGDTVLLLFAERAINDWLRNGGDDITPVSTRRFETKDAMAIPGLRPFSQAIPEAGRADGAMVVRADEIRLGSSAATNYVALANKVDVLISAIDTALKSWPVVPGDGGASLKATWTTAMGILFPGTGGTPTSVGAAKVKAE